MKHEAFDTVLDRLVEGSKVSQDVFGEVLGRVARSAPNETSRLQIGQERPDAGRLAEKRHIPQATVSKVVKALLREGLLEDGKSVITSDEGRRPLMPLRFGRDVVIAGVHVAYGAEWSLEITTALFGLDSHRTLAHRRAELPAVTHPEEYRRHWDDAARLIHQQILDLVEEQNRARHVAQLQPIRLFGVGVEVGGPVNNGVVVPSVWGIGGPGDVGEVEQVDLESQLRELFSVRVEQVIPIVVENDVNALAVLTSHQAHYEHADLCVATVLDKGVGGGLVMDGRLRRGGNGYAMEIGHLPVGYGPGEVPAKQDGSGGFADSCWCGSSGHVDTRATPSRILAQLRADGLRYDTFDEAAHISGSDATNSVFQRAGSALGRAVAHVCNIVNPTKLIIYLPQPLAEPGFETAGSKYRDAATAEITSAFASAIRREPHYLEFLPLPDDDLDLAILGARAAATCVLESFIEHALGLDGCKPGTNRHGGRSKDTHFVAESASADR